MAEFFISLDTVESTAAHQIHNSNCAELPEASTLRYLGSFASGDAAYTKSRGFYDKVSYCPTCFEQASA
ncbi:hypothetical protein WKI13_14170 [Teredinibacter turnerae]|uniref:hypothetical protein n=1 Tax=Teredinibacter turnerae TaxID=2426 RepID=UPI000372D87A|nr:hypothetical protein [Teredinibacter turnerae]